MSTAPPGWYPSPAHQQELRFWDGSTWTEHVVATPDQPSPALETGSRRLGWAGLMLCLVAAVAIALPTIDRARVDSTSIDLDGSRQELSLTPDTTYGIYIDDADNSGYPFSCSAEAPTGQPIGLSDPPFTITSSDTEMLDYVFDSGSGRVTMRCSAGDEKVSAREFRPAGPLAIGVLVAGVTGTLGGALLISWLAGRVDGRRRSR